MKNVNKIILAFWGILLIVCLSSFTFNNSKVDKKSTSLKKTKISMAKKNIKKSKANKKESNQEITETKIEMTPEYARMIEDLPTGVAQATPNNYETKIEVSYGQQ